MKRMAILFVLTSLLLMSGSFSETDQPVASNNVPLKEAMQAQAAFARGDYAEAAQLFEKLRTAQPKNVPVLSNLATAQFRLGRLKQAEATLREALALAPEDGYCRRLLGIVFYSQMKYDAAQGEFTKAVTIDPNDAEAHLYLAFCAGQKGDTALAAKEMATAVRLNPDYAPNAVSAPSSVRPAAPPEAGRHWPVGDYLTPLERSRLRLPPLPVIR